MKTLASLVILLTFTLVIPSEVVGQDAKIKVSGPEKIEVDPEANFLVTKVFWPFCLTEDKLFVIPDPEARTVKIFEKVFEGNKNYLKLVTALGRDGFDETKKFNEPRYCFYVPHKGNYKGTLGVFDYSTNHSERKAFIFARTGKVEFTPIKTVNCPRFAYDMEFSGDGRQLIVSGYTTDENNQPFDLYSINIEDGKTSYLLASHEKYGLKNFDEYVSVYRQEQILPGMGIKAYIDIAGDHLYFAWECSPRITALKLCPTGQREEKRVFKDEDDINRKVSNFVELGKEDRIKMGTDYRKRTFSAVLRKQKKQAYVRNLFATSKYVFLVYEKAKSNQNAGSEKFRLLTYTPEGKLLCDVPMAGSPGKQMWLDEQSLELYAFSDTSGNNGKLSILKYKVQETK
ncbi:MAG: hypothetical protein KAW12_28170 [Candidatus Aminicenantes bacterium]|nr:hypothetical protein [Candidatus Aminicenantes bacterium]